MLHSSGAIDCNILDAIVDPLSIDNLWILPTFSTPGQDSTWPLPEEEAIGYFTPAGDTSTDPRVPILQFAVSYLWDSFVERIAPGITLDVSQTSKLISGLQAENHPPVFRNCALFPISTVKLDTGKSLFTCRFCGHGHCGAEDRTGSDITHEPVRRQ